MIMVLNDIVNLIITNGMAVVIVAYFLFKDYKYNGQILAVLGELRELMAVIKANGLDKQE